MNIAVNINKNFIDITSIMLYSLLANNNEYIRIYILNNDLDDDDFKKMNDELREFNNYMIIDAKVNDSIFPKNNSSFADRWGKQAFYRLLAAEVLPENVERLLYLDADIIINGSLTGLYNIDLKNNYIAACCDSEVSDYYAMDRLGFEDANVYLNAAVILFDLKKIRADGVLTIGKIVEILDRYKNELLFWDQDILNILFCGNALVLEYRRYNFLCSRKRYTNRQLRMYSRNAIVYHFGGEKCHRPWNIAYVGKFSRMFWKYAIKTTYGKENRYKQRINFFFKWYFIFIFEIRIFFIKVKGKIIG